MTDLSINGVKIGRYGVVLNQFSVSFDGPDTLSFTQLSTYLPGKWRQGQTVTLTVDGTLVFVGVIVSLHPSGVGSGPINIGYRCLGLNWLANQVFITGTDGSGKITFNLPTTDPNYTPALAGMSVGGILTYLYNLHSTQLSANYITGFNSLDLAALTIVPPDTFVAQGRLWNVVSQLMATYYNAYGSCIIPSGTYSSPVGTIRHLSLAALPATTFALDALDGSSIPCTLDSISEDFSECYTQVVLRGAANVQGAYLSLVDGTLAWYHSAVQQTAWTYQAYINPPGGIEYGNVTSMSSTTLNVTATYPASIAYGANYWPVYAAEVWAYNPAAAGITFLEQRRITANTAPAANAYTITVDTAFNNSGYTKYQVRALGSFQCVTCTPLQVWRKLRIVPTYVAQHLVQTFSHSVPWRGTDGVLIQTVTPMLDVVFSQAGQTIEWPMTFQLIPSGTSGPYTTAATATLTTSGGAVNGYSGLVGGSGYPPSQTIACQVTGGGGAGAYVTATSNSSGMITGLTVVSGGSGYTSPPTIAIGTSDGYILLDQPVVSAYSTLAQMNAGGSAVSAPSDIRALVPFSTGALSVTAPLGGGYSGTAYSVNGVQRTLYKDYPLWSDYFNASNMQALANQVLATVSNTVVEGALTYYGKQAAFLTLGQAVNVTGNGYTTGYEAINAPARSVVLDFAPEGGAAQWKTLIQFSTRMKPFTGDRLYLHPSYGSQANLSHGTLWGAGWAAGIGTWGLGDDPASITSSMMGMGDDSFTPYIPDVGDVRSGKNRDPHGRAKASYGDINAGADAYVANTPEHTPESFEDYNAAQKADDESFEQFHARNASPADFGPGIDSPRRARREAERRAAEEGIGE
jgi:hypothetical protein